MAPRGTRATSRGGGQSMSTGPGGSRSNGDETIMSIERTSSSTTEIPAAPEAGFPPVHPGEVLREAIVDGLQLTVAETARRIGISRQMVHDILAGRRAVTAETALRFERLGAATARLLLRLQ